MNKSNNLDNFCQFFLALLILYLFSIYLAILSPFSLAFISSTFLFHLLNLFLKRSCSLSFLVFSFSSTIIRILLINSIHLSYNFLNLLRKSTPLADVTSWVIFLTLSTSSNLSVASLILLLLITSKASSKASSLSFIFFALIFHNLK